MSSTLSQRLSHGLLALPLTFAGLPIYLHAPDFYAADLGIPLSTIGLVLLALRMVDAVQDPLIGALSDRYFYHRSRIVLLGALLLAGGFWLLFHPPLKASQFVYLSWLMLSVLICTMGFSIASINLQAAGGLWPVPIEERTSIAATREGLGLIGLLCAAIVPALLFNAMPRHAALHYVCLFLIPLLGVGLWVFARWLNTTPLMAPHTHSALGWRDLLAFTWINRFLIIFALSAFASAIPGILVLFYVRDYLLLESFAGLFLLLYFLSGVLAMPLWQRVTRILSKPMVWLLSMVLACSVFSLAFMLPPQSLVAFSLVCVGSGMALGADLSLPQAIMADHISAQPQAASRYFALMAFLSKAALALATGIVLPLVGWFGFQPGSSAHNDILPFAYALIPCCLKALCIGLLFYYTRRYYALQVNTAQH